ncbi:MAG: hypothetical protein COB24_08930 [Hyphomicrobiales bacterium]|nr:MAG: hypothetical protein COB24_08930 [Hyphomicrobiales bacterium]
MSKNKIVTELYGTKSANTILSIEHILLVDFALDGLIEHDTLVWQSQLAKRFGVEHYSRILDVQFEMVMRYIEGWKNG